MSIPFDTWADHHLTQLVNEMPTLMEPFVDASLEEAERIAYGNLSGRILNSLSGNLRRSLRREVVVTDDGPQGTLTAGSSAAPYARIHEFGGMTGFQMLTRIPARPYLGPAIREAAHLTAPVVGDRLRFALGGG